jgi:hypothetical protein
MFTHYPTSTRCQRLNDIPDRLFKAAQESLAHAQRVLSQGDRGFAESLCHEAMMLLRQRNFILGK